MKKLFLTALFLINFQLLLFGYPTIQIRLVDVQGNPLQTNVEFERTETVIIDGIQFLAGQKFTVQTDANGEWLGTVTPGTFTVRFSTAVLNNVLIPDDDNTYELVQLTDLGPWTGSPGVWKLPHYTTAERDAWMNVENGWMFYNTTESKIQARENDLWVNVVGGGSGSSIVVDLGNDGMDDITGLDKIITANDTNNIFAVTNITELIIDAGKNWPISDDIDIGNLPENVSPQNADFLIIENDTSGAREKVAFSNLPGAGGGTDVQVNSGGNLASANFIDSTDTTFSETSGSVTTSVTQAGVTQHQAALTITESQISDLAHTTDAGDLTSGFLDNARVTESNVTQHEAALTITEGQISDLEKYDPVSPNGSIYYNLNGVTFELETEVEIDGQTENPSPASNDWILAEVNAGGTFNKLQVGNLPFLQNLVEDTTPQLGGDLDSNEFGVFLSDGGTVDAILRPLAASEGGGFGYNDGVEPFDINDGGVTVEGGQVGLYGGNIVVNDLQHSLIEGRQVYVSQTGVLYGVDIPDPGWSENDTDTGTYDLLAGAAVGPTTQITGLSIDPVNDLNIGDKITINVTVWITNQSGNRLTSVDFGYGLNGTFEGTWFSNRTIGPGFSGYTTVSYTAVLTSGISGTDTVDLFMRRGIGEHAQSHPVVDGGGGANTHTMILSTPGQGGGGGDGTQVQINTGGNLSNADFRDSATIEWSEVAGVVEATVLGKKRYAQFPASSLTPDSNDDFQTLTLSNGKKVDVVTMNMASENPVQFSWYADHNWDTGQIKGRVIWHTAATDADNVQWDFRSHASGAGDAFDTVIPSPGELVTTAAASDATIRYYSTTGFFTVNGTPQTGDVVSFEVAATTNSTITEAVHIEEIIIEWNEDKNPPAGW